MNRRPAPRPQPRGGPANAADVRFARPLDVEAATAEPVSAPQPPIPTSRMDLVDLLADLRRQGRLDVADEGALLRRYDALASELRAEKARLEAEYRERLAGDGEDATRDWLAAAAEALGRRQGEQMRQLVQTIPSLSQEIDAHT